MSARDDGRSPAEDTYGLEDLADFFENASVALHWVGPTGVILRANQAELDLLGYDRDEYIGRHIAEFHVDGPAIDDILTRLHNGETLEKCPARLRHKDGSIRDVLISSSVLFRDGEFRHTRCFTFDVTDQRRAEHARSQAERQLRLVADHLPVLIAHCDAQRRYRFVNRAYAERFGIHPDEVIGTPIAEVLGEAAFAAIEPHIVEVLAGQPVEFEREIPYRVGGTQFMHCSYVPERDEDGVVVGWVAAILNITDRKQAEEALRRADQRKDEFLATLAHELRNPLAPIRYALEIMKGSEHDGERLRTTREMMERQLAHLVRLVDDLLDVSRITRDKLALHSERVELGAVIQQAVEACRPLTEEARHQLTLSLPEGPIYLHADPVRLAQVFGNLINNACKYTPAGGCIEVAAVLQGGEVEVRVRDTGVGLSPEMIEHAFEMFAQGDRSLERVHGGLGIGLTLVKRLVEMHGGSVSAASDGEGRGSELAVRLPVPDDQHEERGPDAVQPITAAFAARRILVVDDNPDSASSLAELLEMAGHHAVAVYDGRAALEAAEELRPEVVLLDIGLPEINGYDVCRAIRAQPWGENLRVIALTGLGQEDDRRESHAAGFDGHLVKPVEPAALCRLLVSPEP